MSNAWGILGLSWVLTQALSLLMLDIGSRFAGQRHLVELGRIAHRQKMRALERTWPLTRLRRAIQRRDQRSCTIILSSLIALKSLGCLVLGIVMVFWLPIASLFVPAIVAVHDPDDPSLAVWVRRVAALQVTSHALAAAVGFTVIVVGPIGRTPLPSVIATNAALFASVLMIALALAVVAGRVEAHGVVERGI